MTKKLINTLLLILILFTLVGCNSSNNDFKEYNSLDELDQEGMVIGAKSGTSAFAAAESYFKNATVIDIEGNGFLNVSEGKIDAYVESEVKHNVALASGSLHGVKILNDSIGEPISIVVGLSRKANYPNLKNDIDSFLNYLKENGIIDEMYHRWIEKRKEEFPEIEIPQNPKACINVATTGLSEPFSYYKGSELVGFDIELIKRLSSYLNVEVNLKTYDFYGIMAALETGDVDCVFSNLNATKERAEVIDFSIPVYQDVIKAMVKTSINTNDATFIQSLKNSFEKTFIREDRWKLILSGIKVTVEISLLSAFFGTILGFALCLLCGIKNKFIKLLTTIYIRIIQGTPLVVILMILFYVVFSGSSVGGMTVAIIGFSINFSAYSSQIFRSGIDSIDKGQNEAALALGYTKAQSFIKIVLPQAARVFLPVYKGEFISLVKMTSIVGYVTVQDLTKVSDIIRSRTYEAFFPLIVTAIIYFVISNLLTYILKLIEMEIEPDRKHRNIKGVIMHD